MTLFRDLIKDFPKRCKDVLELSECSAVGADREVTLLLMLASAAFVIPFERLRKRKKYGHPIKDRKRFPQAASEFDQMLENKFLCSELCSRDFISWSSGKLNSVENSPGSWPEIQNLNPMSKEKKVANVLEIIRNALAHGNVYIQGPENIEALIFISGKRSPHKYISVSPSEFRHLLLKWIDFLDKLKMPSGFSAP